MDGLGDGFWVNPRVLGPARDLVLHSKTPKNQTCLDEAGARMRQTWYQGSSLRIDRGCSLAGTRELTDRHG